MTLPTVRNLEDSDDFQIGTNSSAGELPEELAIIMRENSEALDQMRQEIQAGVTSKRVWSSRLPKPVHM